MRKLKLIVLLTGAIAFTNNAFADQQKEQENEVVLSQEDLGKKLFDAVMLGNTEEVKALLEKGVDIETGIQNKETALHVAAFYGQYKVVKLLIEKGADINALECFGRTPLHFAVSRDQEVVVKILLNAKAEINICNELRRHILDYNTTAAIIDLLVDAGAKKEMKKETVQESLKAAVFKKQIDEVKKYIDEGGDVNFISNKRRKYYKYSYHLLGRAARYKDNELLQILIEKGADVNSFDDRGLTALYWAVMHNKKENVELLLNSGSDVNLQNGEDATPLYAAIRIDNIDLVKLLIENGAKINSTHIYNATVRNRIEIMKVLLKEYERDDIASHNLGIAVTANYPEMVKILLDAGEDVNVIDYYGRSPLIYACRNGNLQIVKLLLDAGADIGCEGCNDKPLLVAIYFDQAETVRFLVNRGVDVNTVYNVDVNTVYNDCHKGITAINYAARYCNIELIKLLIELGADVNNISEKGETPLSLLLNHIFIRDLKYGSEEFIQMVKILLAEGADVNLGNEKGKSVLVKLVQDSGHNCALAKEVMVLLIEAGIDVNATDKEGKTALSEALLCERKKALVEVLKEAGA